jgi:hypothetical protein
MAANLQAMCQSFLSDLLNATHAFGASPTAARAGGAKDTFNLALMAAGSSLSAQTASYTAVSGDEVTGTGYTAGGVAVTNATAPANSGGNSQTGNFGFWTPSASAVWTGLTVATSFDAALLYNATAAGKNAVSVHTFTAQTITAGTLTLTMPSNAGGTALINLGT